MLMFTLGPVQTFIEQARKTRDLWLGSFLFAKLMEAAMEDIDKIAVDFVFPIYRKVDNENANLPNKYIAIFRTVNYAKRAVDLSKQQIKDCWEAISEDVWNKIVRAAYTTDVPLKTTYEIWKKQSNPEAFFETFWVIVEGD